MYNMTSTYILWIPTQIIVTNYSILLDKYFLIINDIASMYYKLIILDLLSLIKYQLKTTRFNFEFYLKK